MDRTQITLIVIVVIVAIVQPLTVFGYSIIRADYENKTLFPVSIIHVNDFHARFEEINEYGNYCKKTGDNPDVCIGGYSRMVTVVKRLQKERTNAIYLNAGDNFQGTIWFNIGKWNVTSHFLNLLKADAITLGNHEFDNAIAGVVPFLDSLTSPVIVANIDDSEEPTIQGKYNKTLIIDRYDRKIGIIGIILQTTDQIANTEKLKFFNESEIVRRESEILQKNHNVDIIIVLSHCGLDVDRIIAKNGGPLIDVIVGGHSHTFLYSGGILPGKDKPADNYPVEVIQNSGRKVLIVQASAFTKYVGDLVVYFDELGEIVRYEGSPIYVSNEIQKDPEIERELIPWREQIDKVGLEVIGRSLVDLSTANCYASDCNIGNFITDAYVYEYAKRPQLEGNAWTTAAIGLINVGGIRASIEKGNLTRAQVITATPFENTVDTFELRGKYLLEALEHSVIKTFSKDKFVGAHFLQVSGLKITYDVRRPPYERVLEVLVKCQDCRVPVYEPLDVNKWYHIIAASFLSMGGDGFTMIKDNLKNRIVGPIDFEVMNEYIKRESPIYVQEENRIILYQ